MKEGIIIKGIGGFYYVDVDKTIYECRARGLFRNVNITPLVGDFAKIEIISEEKLEGHVVEIMDRSVELMRPHVANVDQVIITMSVMNPNPNFILLDKLIVLSESHHLEPIICFNKVDLDLTDYIHEIKNIYKSAGYKVVVTSVDLMQGIAELKEVMKDHINVFAGPSGVGKSSLTNQLKPGLELKVGEVSEKIGRGKHTTRHSELIELDFGGFVLDTPGFTSLDLSTIELDELKNLFREFNQVTQLCKFADCKHINEPGCGIKKQVENSTISKMRYESYLYIYNELSQRKERY
ncbi:MAG: ribosome small subunit-dependent GTPase A [Clostridiales bacterium]|nr:ribosome small subunit-dependent GTPase A [Clostridiales bacterium]